MLYEAAILSKGFIGLAHSRCVDAGGKRARDGVDQKNGRRTGRRQESLRSGHTRYIPLKERPKIKESLQRIANRRNETKAFREQVIAELTQQIDRIDESLRERKQELAARKRRRP